MSLGMGGGSWGRGCHRDWVGSRRNRPQRSPSLLRAPARGRTAERGGRTRGSLYASSSPHGERPRPGFPGKAPPPHPAAATANSCPRLEQRSEPPTVPGSSRGQRICHWRQGCRREPGAGEGPRDPSDRSRGGPGARAGRGKSNTRARARAHGRRAHTPVTGNPGRRVGHRRRPSATGDAGRDARGVGAGDARRVAQGGRGMPGMKVQLSIRTWKNAHPEPAPPFVPLPRPWGGRDPLDGGGTVTGNRRGG